MDEIKLMQVIYCTKKRRGNGIERDPIRVITEIFDTEGNLLAENDPYVNIEYEINLITDFITELKRLDRSLNKIPELNTKMDGIDESKGHVDYLIKKYQEKLSKQSNQ